jgi:hypothetical protein
VNYQQKDWLMMGSPSTLSAEGSPAKTSALPEKERDLQALEAASGGSSTGSLRRRSRSGSSRKTYQPFAVEDWTKFSGASLRSGTMRNGTVYPLQPLALLTAGTESGSWPTPTTMDGLAPKTPKAIVREMTEVRPGRTAPSNLRDQVTWGRTFDEVRQKLWPTPTANSSNQCSVDAALREAERLHPQGRWTLMSQVAAEMVHGNRMWPTPDASPHKYRLAGDSQQSRSLNGIHGGKLNPTWVEWLMGFPSDWTALSLSEMPSSRKSRKLSEG